MRREGAKARKRSSPPSRNQKNFSRRGAETRRRGFVHECTQIREEFNSVSYSCAFVDHSLFFLLCGSASLREKILLVKQHFPVEKPE
jgi:hypothetical protein